jgi:hypothetical protein
VDDGHWVCEQTEALHLPPHLQLRLPVCLNLHTVVLSGHGVCQHLALPPSTRALVLENVMRDARCLSLATMVRLLATGRSQGGARFVQECGGDGGPRSTSSRSHWPPLSPTAPSAFCFLVQVPWLKTAVLGMGNLPASLPATVERLAVVGEADAAALEQAYAGLQVLLPQLPNLKELRVTSGVAVLPDAVAALLPRGCQFSTAGMPREGAGVDCRGSSLHQTAQLSLCWCEALLTTEGLDMALLQNPCDSQLSRQSSRTLVC